MEIKTDGERMAVMETKIDAIITAQAATNQKLDTLLPTFVTQTEFTSYKASQNVQKVLLAVLMLIIGSLVGFFISTIVKKGA